MKTLNLIKHIRILINYRLQRFFLFLKYQKRIQVKGNLALSKYSKIILNEKSKGICGNSLTLSDYSFLNLFDEFSRLIIGENVEIKRFCNFNIWNCEVIIGNNVLFNNYCSLNALESIEIGSNTWFGEGVRIYDHNHCYKDSTKPFVDQGFSKGKVKIGNNVWIGSNSVILQNVEIGDNCVIGANNLIFKSIPPNTIVKSNNTRLENEIDKY